MKNLLKLSIIALLIILSFDSFGQTFGIKAGYNLPFMTVEESEYAIPYSTYTKSTEMSSGYHFGGTFEFPVYKIFSLESGLIYSTTGYKQSYDETIWPEPLAVTEVYNLGYLNLPLTLKASFFAGNVSFYGSAGGYLGLGLAGSIKTESMYGETVESEKRSIEWGSEQGADDFEKVDYGLTFGAGAKVKFVQIGVFYNLGLANISPASEAGSSINNSVLGISIGCVFGKSKKAEPSGAVPVKADNSKKGKKEAELEAERIQQEKVKTDSIAAAKIEEERLKAEKAEADSIEAAKVMAAALAAEEAAKIAKIKSDSISAAQNTVIYRVQFASNTVKKGSYEITIGGKKYNTWEYSYSGAYRSTVGEFNTYKSALEFQKSVRQSGYPQAFVVALKNNIRTTDPALFK